MVSDENANDTALMMIDEYVNFGSHTKDTKGLCQSVLTNAPVSALRDSVPFIMR